MVKMIDLIGACLVLGLNLMLQTPTCWLVTGCEVKKEKVSTKAVEQ